jgi:hypothetical protein
VQAERKTSRAARRRMRELRGFCIAADGVRTCKAWRGALRRTIRATSLVDAIINAALMAYC